MVICLPCIAAPVLLFIWYKFIYPLVRPILERYFGNRFAEPKDGSCPICPRNSKGECDLQQSQSQQQSTSSPSESQQQELKTATDKKES